MQEIEQRRSYADELIKQMKSDERLASMFWRFAKYIAEEEIKTDVMEDSGIHDEYGTHGAFKATVYFGGLGMKFPPYPFQEDG